MKRSSEDDFPMDAVIRVVHSAPQVDDPDKVPEGHTAVPVEWVQDHSLSLGARGLLVEIMAHGGEWDIDPEGLAELKPAEDVETIRGYIAELEQAGYLEPSGE
ncbi:hypothetical protein ACWGCW_00765 [Streptomyces sp. NPDC054933]